MQTQSKGKLHGCDVSVRNGPSEQIKKEQMFASKRAESFQKKVLMRRTKKAGSGKDLECPRNAVFKCKPLVPKNKKYKE